MNGLKPNNLKPLIITLNFLKDLLLAIAIVGYPYFIFWIVLILKNSGL